METVDFMGITLSQSDMFRCIVPSWIWHVRLWQYPELNFSGTLQHALAQSSSYRLVYYLLDVFRLPHGSYG